MAKFLNSGGAKLAFFLLNWVDFSEKIDQDCGQLSESGPACRSRQAGRYPECPEYPEWVYRNAGICQN